MDLIDHFSEEEIDVLEGLPQRLRLARWGIILTVLFMLVVAVLCLHQAARLGEIMGAGGPWEVLTLWFAKNASTSPHATLMGYEWSMMNLVAMAKDLLVLALLFMAFYFVLRSYALLLVKTWRVLKYKGTVVEENGR